MPLGHTVLRKIKIFLKRINYSVTISGGEGAENGVVNFTSTKKRTLEFLMIFGVVC